MMLALKLIITENNTKGLPTLAHILGAFFSMVMKTDV